MSDSTATARKLSLPEELVLMLLNEQNGWFHQVPWLGSALRRRGRGPRGTFPARTDRHGPRLAVPAGPDGNRRCEPRSHPE